MLQMYIIVMGRSAGLYHSFLPLIFSGDYLHPQILAIKLRDIFVFELLVLRITHLMFGL